MGKVVWTEKVLVGEGYAGRADILVEGDGDLFLTDFKTTGKLPKNGSYTEHLLQTSVPATTLAGKHTCAVGNDRPAHNVGDVRDRVRHSLLAHQAMESERHVEVLAESVVVVAADRDEDVPAEDSEAAGDERHRPQRAGAEP